MIYEFSLRETNLHDLVNDIDQALNQHDVREPLKMLIDLRQSGGVPVPRIAAVLQQKFTGQHHLEALHGQIAILRQASFTNMVISATMQLVQDSLKIKFFNKPDKARRWLDAAA
jgi:hypothetical protein